MTRQSTADDREDIMTTPPAPLTRRRVLAGLALTPLALAIPS
jgi:hypothetical protein